MSVVKPMSNLLFTCIIWYQTLYLIAFTKPYIYMHYLIPNIIFICILTVVNKAKINIKIFHSESNKNIYILNFCKVHFKKSLCFHLNKSWVTLNALPKVTLSLFGLLCCTSPRRRCSVYVWACTMCVHYLL